MLSRSTDIKILWKDKSDDIAVIGPTVLEGSVRKAGNRMGISVQLVKVGDG